MTPVPVLFAPPKPWEPDDWFKPGPPVALFNRNEPAVRQTASWTCAAASMAWVMNALQIEAPGGGKWTEWTSVAALREVGGPAAITPEYGLAYASGVDLEKVYVGYGLSVERIVPATWSEVALASERTIGQLGGARWYHWTGLRGYDGQTFSLANPAPNWKGVGDDLDDSEWDRWGAWNAVMITGEHY